MRTGRLLLGLALALWACGGEDDGGDSAGGGGMGSGGTGATGGAATGGTGGSAGGAGTGGSAGGAGTGGSAGGAGTGGSAGGAGTGGSAGGAGTGGTAGACDYQVGPNGVLVIEAESLTLTEQWQIATKEAGYYAKGYIQWTGSSQNSTPGQGVLTVKIAIDQPGRYRFDWRARIGLGTNTTEHNDTWLRFPDAESYYGMKKGANGESRRYPKPKCDDTAFMTQIEALATVDSATCPNGSSKDGWLKVYSAGASTWKWSALTSDNDGHDIYVNYPKAGTYTLELSARADYHLIDRIVLHREAIALGVAQAASLTETPCP